MRKSLYNIFIIFLFCPLWMVGQEHYQVSKTMFSSNKYDEFCPVIVGDSIVFCSNLENELFVTYQDREKKGLFNIFYIPKEESKWNEEPKVLSQNIITPFNDGPASFSPDGKIVVYSRNVDAKVKVKNVFDLSNTLGLFFAERIGDTWTNITQFQYNSIDYAITMPCFSPDGQYLYFASNMPGSIGGIDLFRCALIDGKWSEPENLGDEINTKGSEVYPFISPNGDLFFASDGHGGIGEKDIFQTRQNEEGWIKPLHLEAPINSKKDDFGFITDANFTNGYFSSNRGKSDDIYSFSTLVPQLFDCDTLLENNYCYEFWDEKYPSIDSLPVIYEWEFSDGVKTRGLHVEHCFPGPGNYWAKLNIIDNSTSNTFFTQHSMEFELQDHIQPFISSKDVNIAEMEMQFSGLESNIPGFVINQYIWDFGDGSFETGSEINHKYKKSGEYNVKLGIAGSYEINENKETRCVVKPINILPDNQAMAMFNSGIKSFVSEKIQANTKDTERVEKEFSVFEINPEEEVFRVEVLATEKKVMLGDTVFDALRDEYEIKEFYLKDDSLYSYTVGEESSLLNTYKVYNDVVSKGFNTAKVKTYVLAELPVDIIAKINKDFAELIDANFEFNEYDLTESSYGILNKVVEIFMKNPDLSMEIAAHTDNIGSFEFNIQLSQKRAQAIVDYLISEGINENRLQGKGYGESRPISSNHTEEGRMKNRRVEFIILNK